VHDLRGDEDDTQGNHRFDRWTRHVYPAQRGGCKRDAMGNRERRDGEEDSLAIANDQQQCQHEQQMVDTTENVFYTEHQIEDQATSPVPVGAFTVKRGSAGSNRST
jgi:hypothetical protein